MSAIRQRAAVNVRGFQSLVDSLQTELGRNNNNNIDLEALQDELGRFRVWSGNLGALQKGHSSLDYRLRDAPLLSNEVSKLLNELETNLHAAYEIVSGARLPYEQQQHSENPSDEDEDDSFFSEEEDEGNIENVPKTELNMRFKEIVDIVDHLYKVGVRIRAPTVHIRSLKAASYQPKDPDTGIDLLDQYATFDTIHVRELVRYLRMPHTSPDESAEELDDLVNRLARANTLRRRQFKYWRRHRDKLGISTDQEDLQAPAVTQRPVAPPRHDTLEAQPGGSTIHVLPKQAPSQKTEKTLLSGTEATHHHQSLDDLVDTKSVTSYAVTVKDLSGKGIDLPPPPKAADGGKDFECPYCFIICPARYGKGRPWRTHVLQDLQPYVCTYPECQATDQLFRSRRDWAEHESSHRKVWRCPEHPDAVYKSQAGLEEHIKSNHGASIRASQIPSVAKVGETSTVDLRHSCPICYASVETEGMGTLQNHIANHLERIAAFSLPIDVDDDSDGGSSRASRGRTDSSAIRTASWSSVASEYSDSNDERNTETNSNEISPTHTGLQSPSAETRFGLLSESLIQALPDDSEQRFDLLFSGRRSGSTHSDDDDQSQDEDEREDSDSLFEGEKDEIILNEQTAEREAFQAYLLSFPGVQEVRFSKRNTYWKGTANFENADFATTAMQEFEKKLYPRVRLQQKVSRKETLIFNVPQHSSTKQASLRPFEATVSSKVPSESYQKVLDDYVRSSPPILHPDDIPNMQSLYLSGKLVPPDEASYIANDRFNEIVSFLSYDVTLLKVDAIVISSNTRLMPRKPEWSLNNTIHTAAGPGLEQECLRLERIDIGQSVLTGAHQLPSNHIIHVAVPHYSFLNKNILIECYRGALRLALEHDLKTIAFCCIGTGHLGFPARSAAKIALQEVREFLDAHSWPSLERIVFCVYNKYDSAAYTEILPSFFPYTREDLDDVDAEDITAKVDALIDFCQRACILVEDTTQKITSALGAADVHFAKNELSSIAKSLMSYKDALLELQAARLITLPKRRTDVLRSLIPHVDLLCSVLMPVCTRIWMDMIEIVNGILEDAPRIDIWNSYNDGSRLVQGLKVIDLIDLCYQFTQHLNDVIQHDMTVTDEMRAIGIRLSAWLKESTETKASDIQYDLREASLEHKNQRNELGPNEIDVIKLAQVPTLAHLYQQGALQADITDVAPSNRFNRTVCLVREDITKLEVDVIVSSTDPYFSGNGRLDRTVSLGGGPGLQEECAKHATCSEGEVILTSGHNLPAQHVLHAIPPLIYHTGTLEVLRKIYRKILHMSSYLNAKSIAIPSLGTGIHNYPRRETATIAIEEVKKFLESMDESSPIEKIVFVVFSSNDEFVYKNILPRHLPPDDLSGNLSESTRSPPRAITPRSRGLFDTLGDAFRKLTPGRQSVPNTRSLEPSEEDLLIEFETHAQGCSTCSNISSTYAEGKDLCDEGYRLAAHLLRHLHMRADQTVHPLRSVEDFEQEIEIPDVFPLSLELLHTVEKSFRNPDRDRPFVSNQPSMAPRRRLPEYTVLYIEVTFVSSPPDIQQIFDRIYIWSDSHEIPDQSDEVFPTLHLARGQLVILDDSFMSPMRWTLSPQSNITVRASLNIVVDYVEAERNPSNKSAAGFMLGLRSQTDCEMLLTRVKHAAKNSPTPALEEGPSRDVATTDTTATKSSHIESQAAFADVKVWAQATDTWDAVDAEQYKPSLYVSPGSLEIVHRGSSYKWRMKLTSYSIIKEQSGVEILVDRVTMAGDNDSGLGRWKRLLLKCRSQTERDVLMAHLLAAADPSRTSPTIVWFCGHCGDGPHNIVFLKGCTNCGHMKDNCCSVSTLPRQSTNLLPMPTNEPLNEDESAVRAKHTSDVLEPEETTPESDVSKEAEIAPSSGVGFPGYLEYRILNYMQSLPRSENQTIHEDELVSGLFQPSNHITVAVEHLRSLNLIEAVPGHDRTWTIVKSQSDFVDAAPKADSGSDETKSSEHKASESSKPPQAEDADDRQPGIPDEPTDEASRTPSRRSSAGFALPYSLAALVDPKLIPLEELDIERYFVHRNVPSAGIHPPPNTGNDEAKADRVTGPSESTTFLTPWYEKPSTWIDKRLVYGEVLDKAGLSCFDVGEWWILLELIGQERIEELHRETRNTPRFTP